MPTLPVLDVAIGLSFVYLLLGLICTTVNEMIANWRDTRSKYLARGVVSLLGKDLAAKVFQHSLIQSLHEAGHAPSYIPASKFATALLDVVSGEGQSLRNVAAVKEGADKFSQLGLGTSLHALIDSTGGDPVALQKAVETWFEEGMDRVSGWYKRNAQRNTLILAAITTLVMNADTVFMAHTLWRDPVLRAAVVDEARIRSEKRPPDQLPMVDYANPNDATASTPQNVPSNDQTLSDNEEQILKDLTGWAADWSSPLRPSQPGSWFWNLIVAHLMGWIITAIAVSLGAPFWFDTLNRFMNIRNAGRAPDEPRDKSTSAPQSPTAS